MMATHENGSRPGVGFHRTYPSSTTSLNAAREDAAAYMSSAGVERPTLEDARLVVSELVTNAVQASEGKNFRLQVSVQPRSVSILVANPSGADAFPPRAQWGPDSALAVRGRGLAIVEHLADSVDHRTVDGWTEVTAVLTT